MRKHEMNYTCIREDCGGTCYGCCCGSCKNCGGSEGQLATECPGYQLNSQTFDNIYNGVVDFIGGRWVFKGATE